MRVKINYCSLFHNVYKSTVETPEQGMEYLQNYGWLYLITLKIFYSLQFLLVWLASNCYFQYSSSRITYSKSAIKTLE